MPQSPSTPAVLTQPFQRFLSTIKMSPILTTVLGAILSWRTIAILLAYLNLKSIPGAWHVRLFYLMVRSSRDVDKNRAFLKTSKQSSNKIHPIFRYVQVESFTSLYETDYNLHKSNSTYFADLDHSRTALVSSLLTPALAQDAMVPSGFKPGLLFPVLGSVHTSFLREIKPLQRYYVRSRVLGWDRKWLVVVSYFVRPTTKAEKIKMKKDGKEVQDEILLACALNKYVIKSGRLTVDPGLCLAKSGWFELPSEEDTKSEAAKSGKKPDAEGTGSSTPNPVAGPSNATMEAAGTMQRVARRLSSNVGSSDRPKGLTSAKEDTIEEADTWTWKQIDAERRRGLELAEKWLGLDSDLREEYEHSLLNETQVA